MPGEEYQALIAERDLYREQWKMLIFASRVLHQGDSVEEANERAEAIVRGALSKLREKGDRP
jgi:hypothetical protein